MLKNKRKREWHAYNAAAKKLFESAELDESVIALFADEADHERLVSNVVEHEQETFPADVDSPTEDFYFSDGNSESSEDLDVQLDDGQEPAWEDLFRGCKNVFSEQQQLVIRDKVADWAARYRVTRDQGNSILKILNTIFPLVPRDVRTLLQTTVSVNVVQKVGGDYSYFGILKSLINNNLLEPNVTKINIQLNVDGVPLYNSSPEGFWPILMSANGSNPVAVALYYGSGKPSDVTGFMADFVEEYSQLSQGFDHEDTIYSVTLHSFICDAPARAFLKSIISHNGIDACERCCTKGIWKAGRVCFNDFTAPPRTDQEFSQQRYEDNHQTGISPLSTIFGCVTGFPLDYMHLVCLGVMKRIVKFWKTEKTSTGRLSQVQLAQISTSLEQLNGQMPSEFARQPRSLKKSDRWKATEWRQFVLYTGMVVLKNVVSLSCYHHFMCLCIAMSILLDEDDDFRNHYLEFAHHLLVTFVKEARRLYGETFPSYNVHSLIHLVDDCRHFGTSLNSLSAFPYENFLGQMKKLVRNKNSPITQVARRLSERQDLVGTKEIKTKLVANLRNGVVKLLSGEIGFILEESGDLLNVRVVPRERLQSSFTVPLDSLDLGIGQLRRSILAEMPVREIRRGDVQKKMICLSLTGETSLTILPVHHC